MGTLRKHLNPGSTLSHLPKTTVNADWPFSKATLSSVQSKFSRFILIIGSNRESHLIARN